VDIAGVVIKADDAKRFLLTVAYPAYKFDVALAADGHIDVAPEDVVERACWGFMRKGARLGMWHEKGHEDAGEVVENYIHRGDPWHIKAADGTDQTIMPGDWLVGIVCSEYTWALYKSDAIGGVSPQGGASRQSPSEATLARVRSRTHG
jgi:Putative phage serine protease XkdF